MPSVRAVSLLVCSGCLLLACGGGGGSGGGGGGGGSGGGGGGGSGGGGIDIGTTTEQLVALKAHGIFFGHQSVGNNIMAGVDELLADVPEADRLGRGGILDAGAGAWVDDGVGTNGDPLGKLADFRSKMVGLCSKVDIAFMKFCWADTNYLEGDGGGSPQALFDHYKATMDAVHTACPGATLVHFTMPLEGWAKEIREDYNALVRAEYGTALFDLAKEESTLPSGERCLDGGVPILCAEYSTDGGHPDTAEASKRMAAKLIALLASLK